ncbi:MAG: serine/threonine protein kinase [Proteobacteria bacterium]|nr:serine/threonine protein kinase [Pseudomonadota bacterium]
MDTRQDKNNLANIANAYHESAGSTSGESAPDDVPPSADSPPVAPTQPLLPVEHKKPAPESTGEPEQSSCCPGTAYQRRLLTEDAKRYRFLRERGRGGLGRVMEAHDERLGRTVAIKEMLKVSDFAESLFVREALITARLQHPGIVPVHEAGRWPSGEPFYVMKLLSGNSLLTLIRGAKTLRERLAYLPNLIAVVETIAYAHSQGVVHRDIKPANVVVGSFGETMVVDWGLARDTTESRPFSRDLPDIDLAAEIDVSLGEDADQSAGTVCLNLGNYSISGKVIGTPAYMAPEQARGENVDEPADVYALGSVLYELLAGKPPYSDADPRSVVDQVLAGPPIPLSARADDLPPDLIAIVDKAMARHPADRYATAKKMAEDLKRYQTGKLVSVHEYSTWLLLQRWLWRHRSPVLVALAAIIVLIAMGSVGINRIVAAKDRAEAEREFARRNRNELLLSQAKSSLSHDPTATVAWLKQVPFTGNLFHQALGYYDEAVARGVARHVIAHRSRVMDVAFTHDGRHVLTASLDGTVRLIHGESGDECLIDSQGERNFQSLAVSRDGVQVAAGTQSGSIRLFRLSPDYTVAAARSLEGHASWIKQLRFTEEGHLLSVSWDGTARSWDVTSGRTTKVFEFNTVAAFDPNGSRIALDSTPRELSLVDTATGAELWRIALPVPFEEIGFSPDGSSVAAYGQDEVLRIIDSSTGKVTELGDMGKRQSFLPLAFSPTGRWLAAPGRNSAVYLWNLEQGGLPRVLRGHTSHLLSLTFSSDETMLASSSDDDTARLWDLKSDHVQVLLGHTDDVFTAAFNHTDDMVATGSLDGTARIWPVGRRDSVRLSGQPATPVALRFADGHELTTLAGNGEVRRWNATRTESVVVRSGGYRATIADATVSPDHRFAVWLRPDRPSIELWDLADGSHRELAGHEKPVLAVEFARDRAIMASVDRDGVVILWSLESGTSTALVRDQPMCGVALSADGSRLAVAMTARVDIVDIDSGKTVAHMALPGDDRSCAVTTRRFIAYSPSARWIAVSGVWRGLWLWDLATDTLRELDTERHRVTEIAASPDGSRLAVALEEDRSIRLWETANGVMHYLGTHSDLPTTLAFSPDSGFLVSGSTDRTVRLWHRDSGTVRILRGHSGQIRSIAFSSDSRYLASGSADRSVRVWDLSGPHIASAGRFAALVQASTTVEIDERLRARTRTRKSAAASMNQTASQGAVQTIQDDVQTMCR